MNTDTNKEATPVTLRPGLTVKVHQKIRETNTKGEEKERIQIFEGLVIGVKKPNSPEGTFTVRKDSAGVGVEKVFPINSPLIVKLESVKKAKVKRAKLYFTRHSAKRLKEKKVA